MKLYKKYIARGILCSSLIFSTAFAQVENTSLAINEKEDVIKTELANNDISIPKLTMSNIEYKDAKELTLEEAKNKAISSNISMKLQEIAISQSEEAEQISKNGIIIQDPSGTGYTVIEDNSISGLLRRNAASLGTKAAQRQQEVLEESIGFLAQKTYEEIIQLEKQLSITKASFDLSEENLDIIKKKVELGMESEFNLSTATKNHKQLESQIENLNTTLASKYIELNSLIGEDLDTRFILKDEVAYTPLEEINLNRYISKKISEDFYVWYSEENKELQDLELKAYEWSPTNTWTMQKNKYTQAELEEKTTKQNLEKALKERYNQIMQLQEQIEISTLDLKKAEEAYNIAKQQYTLGMITALQLKQSELGVYNANLALEQNIIQHNQLKQTFYQPHLNPSYAN